MTTLTIFTCPAGDGGRLSGRLEVAPARALQIDDAAAVEWAADEVKPNAWQVRPPGDGRRMLSGAFWGMLFAHLFLIPLSRLTPPRFETPEADRSLIHLGLGPDQLGNLRTLIVPGVAAFLVLHSRDQRAALIQTLGLQPGADIELTPVESRRLFAGFGEPATAVTPD